MSNYSALQQDDWVLECTGYQKGLYFVDVGAHDGITQSNTYLLEKEYDWKGVCIEPNPEVYFHLTKNRKCVCRYDCIGANSGELQTFLIADVPDSLYSGLTNYMGTHVQVVSGRELVLITSHLENVLDEVGSPKLIDFLSIDTEGSEFEILSSLSFSNYQFRYICVEHNFEDSKREKMRYLLETKGYEYCEPPLGKVSWDDFYRLP